MGFVYILLFCLQIAQKIAANERFVAYIVIPMFPEGDPTSAPIQVWYLFDILAFAYFF